MTNEQFDRCFHKVDDFVSSSSSGTATLDNIAEFDEFLSQNDLARRIYVEHLLLTLAVPRVMARVLPDEPQQDALVERADRVELARDSQSRRNYRQRVIDTAKLIASNPYSIPVLSASLFLAAVLLTLAVIPQAQWQPSDTTIAEVSANDVVAVIRGEQQVVWVDPSRSPTDRFLRSGDAVQFEEGLVEISFRGGPLVVLEGPCVFTPIGPTLGELTSGRLFARVGESARGFAIRTDTTLIVDLGTEFGVETQPNGETVTHVAIGRVAVELLDEKSSRRTIVSAGNAVTVSRREGKLQIEPSELPEEQFANLKLLLDKKSATSVTAGPIDEAGPPLAGLELWLAADRGTARSESGNVQFWRDARHTGLREPPRAFAADASRAPLWVTEGINGRPTLRFDGNDVIRLPEASGVSLADRDYEMFFVARTASQEVQFLVAGGITSYELHLNVPGARFIPSAPYNLDRSSDIGGATEYSEGAAHLFSVRVDREQEFRGIVRVDGIDSTDATAGDARSSDIAPLQFGMRISDDYGFKGDLSEILIYTRSLTAAERTLVERYLMKKYQLNLKPLEGGSPEQEAVAQPNE